jgi:hypothetical protein
MLQDEPNKNKLGFGGMFNQGTQTERVLLGDQWKHEEGLAVLLEKRRGQISVVPRFASATLQKARHPKRTAKVLLVHRSGRSTMSFCRLPVPCHNKPNVAQHAKGT